MKRFLAIAVLALALALGVTVTTPPQSAHALASLACSNSLTCQPANLPILIDLGIVSAGGVTVAAPAVTAGTAAGVLTLTGSVPAITGIVAVASGLSMVASAGTQGVQNIKLKTDPAYIDPAPTTCTRSTTAVASGSQITYCPAQTAHTSGGVLGGTVHSVTTLGAPSGGVVTTASTVVTVAGLTGSAGSAGWSLQTVCRNLVSLAYSVHGSTASSTTLGTIPGTYASTCPAGYSFAGLTLGVRDSSGAYKYTVVDHANRVVPDGTRMVGSIRTTVGCKDIVTLATTSVVTTASVNIAYGEALDVPEAMCGPGTYATTYAIDWMPSGGSSWISITTPGTVPAWFTDLPTEYPNCFNGSTICAMTLWKGPSPSWESCGSIGQYCQGWAASPDAATLYRCQYGEYVVELDLCSMYRDPTVGVLPNTNTDGSTIPYTQAPPTTLPNPTTNEDGTVTEQFPWLDDSGEPDLEEQASACFPSGWGVLNPVSWVVMPVGCALRSAFVPSQAAITTAQQDMQTAIDESIFGDVEMLTESVTAPFQIGSTGCAGPAFPIDIHDLAGGGMSEVYYPLSACTEPMLGYAGFFRVISQGFVLVGAGLAAIRYFASIAGFVAFGSGNGGNASRVVFKETS